jgi:hypothetical protein
MGRLVRRGGQRARLRIVAAAAWSLLAAGSAGAQEGDEAAAEEGEPLVAYAIDIDFVSRYAWRGLAWTEGMAMQPGVTIDSFGFSLWGWTNLVLQREDYEGQFNELDGGLSYTYAWDFLELSGGLQVWSYPYQADSPTTGQADVALWVPLGELFYLYTQQTVDIGSYAGAWYGELGATFAYETEAGPIVEAAVLTGWASDKFNETYIGVAQTAWNVVQAGFSVTFPLSYVYIRLHAQASYLLDADLRAAVDDPFLAVGGIALGTEGPP